jgi:hypothetical protein
MTKPLLLLDVDGPLNPYKADPPPAGGYREHFLVGDSFTDDQGHAHTGGLRVLLHPDTGRMLLALTDLVDLVWATAWEDMANKLIAPAIGLPQLPLIHFPRRRSYPFGQIFKRDDVEAYVGDRPFAWFDDDFQTADYFWACQRTDSGIPTRLRWVDPAIGLTQLDVDVVADWARDLTAAPATSPVVAGA